MKSKTQVFKSYEDFLDREDKRINGVSEEFAKKHPYFAEDNETNVGCWNCLGCEFCYRCMNSVDCYSCEDSNFLFNCVCVTYSESSSYCFACNMIKYCKYCFNCNHCYYCDFCFDSQHTGHKKLDPERLYGIQDVLDMKNRRDALVNKIKEHKKWRIKTGY